MTIEDFKCPPCLGCGWCCAKATCALGLATYDILRTIGGLPCPALYFKRGRYWCKLYDPEKYPELFGYGCGHTLGNSWRKDVKER